MGYLAETYERVMIPALMSPWAAQVIRAVQVQPGERALDVACGTGVVARRLAPLVGTQGQVFGLDRNPEMLRVARLAADREGLAIDWRLGQAEQLPFPDGAFDVIVCQFALMYFADRRAALAEMRRALSASGRVGLGVWQAMERHPFYQALDEVSQRRLGRSSVQGMFSLADAEELRGLLADAGFQRVEIESLSLTARFEDPEALLAWELDVDPATAPALRDLDAPARQAILAALHEEMQAPLRAVMQDGQVRMPFHAHIAHGWRS